MTILYRTAGPWGGGIGANLTAAQVDGNFYDVHTRVQYLELHPIQPVQIMRFSVTGSNFFIYMSDGSVQGPFTLPVVRWNFRGPWQTSVQYFADDVVTGPDTVVYLVLLNHISSSSTFDPGANGGMGRDYYRVLLAPPEAILPAGGVPGQVLTRSLPMDYTTMWTSVVGLPPGGTVGRVLVKSTSSDYDAAWMDMRLEDIVGVSLDEVPEDGDYIAWDASIARWINKSPGTLNVITASSWAPTIGNEGAFMVLTNGATNTSIVVPSNDVEPFAIGTELHVHQDGTGVVTIVGDTGVTVHRHASFSNRLLGQYATATVKKTGANDWRLFGLLELA